MDDSFYVDVYRTLKKTHYKLLGYLSDKLAQSGITWPQFHALYHISDEGIPVNELARELGCNASNITGLIDRMIENGWVYREHSEEDRRVWLVRLTGEGSRLKEKLVPEYYANIRERLSVLNRQELESLKSMLERLKSSIN